jgi:uncharacterized protein (UPF0332 family)
MFALHFVRTKIIDKEHADVFTDIFDMRQMGDYDDFVTIDEHKVLQLLPQALELIEVIEQQLQK